MSQFRAALLPPAGGTPREVSTAVNSALKGKTNNIATLRLSTGTAITTFVNPLLTAESWLGFDPVTDPAYVIDPPYARASERTSGECLVRHQTVTANATFYVQIVG